MKILITGGSGFVGRRVCELLLAKGHSLILLTRGQTPIAPFDPLADGQSLEICKMTADGRLPLGLLEGIEGIVNLAGEPIASGRWSATRKHRILDSRVNLTRQLVDAIENAHLAQFENQSIPSCAGTFPRVLVNASAVGYYGTSETAKMTESSPPGDDFLARVCIAWEAAAMRAEQCGVRTVRIRIGLVLGHGAQALRMMALPFRFFVGGPLGNGRQWFPWIHREDLARLFVLALEDDTLHGPVNAVAPQLVRQFEVSKAIGRVLRRPSWLPVPAIALRLLFGEQAQVLLAGQQVSAEKLAAHGFTYLFPTIEAALAESLCPDNPEKTNDL